MGSDKENDSSNKENSVLFYGEDSKWREFAMKAKAIGEKKGWWTATHTDLTKDKSEKAETANSSAMHWLLMACKDEAFSYI